MVPLVSAGFGAEQHEKRPKAFSTCLYKVSGDFLYHRYF
jgi:hypothetical protein